jgi:thioredoxin-dependent peroxiredoxin
MINYRPNENASAGKGRPLYLAAAPLEYGSPLPTDFSRMRPPMSDWLEAGTKAPAFTLAADDGNRVKLSELQGSPVVLYFYPADDTPGCTREACAFRDRKSDLQALGVKVFGVSPDDVASHVKFRDKYQLNFPLLADPDHGVAEKFGAWREKNMYGKKSMGIARSTFLIDAKGVIRKVWKAVKVDGHDEAVIAAARELLAAE